MGKDKTIDIVEIYDICPNFCTVSFVTVELLTQAIPGMKFAI
jgi:hypothetical protein